MDITQLILDDHHEQRRLFAILEQIDWADAEVLSAVWGRLASFLELHAAAEKAVFCPALLQEANARLREQNAELQAQLAEQAEKITRLERLISRNSGNSSMPPSTDDQPGKKPPERKPRRGGRRRPGKQADALGAKRRRQGRGDLGPPARDRGAAPAGRPPGTGLG